MTDYDFTQPFDVQPIINGIEMIHNDVHVKVVHQDGGQDVHAWLTGRPLHPITGEEVIPYTRKLELPGTEMPEGTKREAFHILHPNTHSGVALAVHPLTGQLIGWYPAVLAFTDDLELGVPEEWTRDDS